MIASSWRQLGTWWENDRGLSLLLALLLVRIFLLPALSGPGPQGTLGRVVTDLVLSLLLLAGVGVLAETAWTRAALGLPAVAAIGGLWLDWMAPGLVPVRVELLAVLIAAATLVVVTLAQVFRGGAVTMRRVLGAVAAYLLLGLIWAVAYQVVALDDPAAFTGLGADSQRLIYFSFVTLTTVGYGDITPLHPAARSLATLEALIGQLYPAILIARLVSLEVQSRSEPGARG